MAKNLIIYYSRTGENDWNGSIKNIVKGNTEIVTEFIPKAYCPGSRSRPIICSTGKQNKNTPQSMI